MSSNYVNGAGVAGFSGGDGAHATRPHEPGSDLFESLDSYTNYFGQMGNDVVFVPTHTTAQQPVAMATMATMATATDHSAASAALLAGHHSVPPVGLGVMEPVGLSHLLDPVGLASGGGGGGGGVSGGVISSGHQLPPGPGSYQLPAGPVPVSACPRGASEDSEDSAPLASWLPPHSAAASDICDVVPLASPPIATAAATAATAKKQLVRSPRRRKQRDPNEPQRPVSAYALFFRDTQAAIKSHNPGATFGQVSRIVASMWDALEASKKAVYKTRAEEAKLDYVRAMASYRAGGEPITSASSAAPQQNAVTHLDMNTGSVGHSQPAVQPALFPMAAPATATAGLACTHSDYTSSLTMTAAPVFATPATATTSQSAESFSTVVTHQIQPDFMPMSRQCFVPTNAPVAAAATAGGGAAGAGGGAGAVLVSNAPVQAAGVGTVADASSAQLANSFSPACQLAAPPADAGRMLSITSNGQPPTTSLASAPAPMPAPTSAATTTAPTATTVANAAAATRLCARPSCQRPAITDPEWDSEYCSSGCVVTHCNLVFGQWVTDRQLAQQQQQQQQQLQQPV